MKKELLALLLTLLLCTASTALADLPLALNRDDIWSMHAGYTAGSWQRADATLLMKIATRTGPGTGYTEPGTFLQAGDRVSVISKIYDEVNEIWWVQVEFSYNHQWYRAYTGAQRMSVDLTLVPTECALADLDSRDEARNYYEGSLRYGPGTDYALMDYTLPDSSWLYVIMCENDWALVEVMDATPSVRGWVSMGELQY